MNHVFRLGTILLWVCVASACGDNLGADDGDAAAIDGRGPIDARDPDAGDPDARVIDASVNPTVTSTNPADLATNVAVGSRVSATFSRAMNPTTLTNLTFTLRQGANTIAGTVSYDALSMTATFTPTLALDLSLVYTATITTGAADPAGNALAADHVWTFTTGACTQSTVPLLTAGNFAILAGSTVTNTGLTTINGNVGVSPGTEVTGFPPGIVVGLIHPGTAAAAQGIADLTTAYNDAAGRSLCPVSVAGNLGGQTLTAGLYKSTSSLEITSGDLTLDGRGDPDAIFIFQMASTFTTSSGRQVVLIGGARAANVFWQVGSAAALGTTSSVSGTIMADQMVSLATGASLNGRALARIAEVTLDGNAVVRPVN